MPPTKRQSAYIHHLEAEAGPETTREARCAMFGTNHHTGAPNTPPSVSVTQASRYIDTLRRYIGQDDDAHARRIAADDDDLRTYHYGT